MASVALAGFIGSKNSLIDNRAKVGLEFKEWWYLTFVIPAHRMERQEDFWVEAQPGLEEVSGQPVLLTETESQK